MISIKKSISRKTLIKKLDSIFSLFIRLRDKRLNRGYCLLCNKRPIECCFHWIGRGSYATRWDEDNAVGSCFGCNFEETFRKQKYRDKHIALIGIEEREILEALARQKTHFSNSDLQEMIEEFKLKISS